MTITIIMIDMMTWMSPFDNILMVRAVQNPFFHFASELLKELGKSPFSQSLAFAWTPNSIPLTCPVLNCTTQIWLKHCEKFYCGQYSSHFPLYKIKCSSVCFNKSTVMCSIFVISIIIEKHRSHLSIVILVIIFWKRLQMCWKLTL